LIPRVFESDDLHRHHPTDAGWFTVAASADGEFDTAVYISLLSC
jgi:hypothetical protein